MAKERDYKHELELAKARGEKYLSIKITDQIHSDFEIKCATNGITKTPFSNNSFSNTPTASERTKFLPVSDSRNAKPQIRDSNKKCIKSDARNRSLIG